MLSSQHATRRALCQQWAHQGSSRQSWGHGHVRHVAEREGEPPRSGTCVGVPKGSLLCSCYWSVWALVTEVSVVCVCVWCVCACVCVVQYIRGSVHCSSVQAR